MPSHEMIAMRLRNRLMRVERIVESDIHMVGLKGNDRFEGISMGRESAIRPHDISTECNRRFHRSLFMLPYR
jgi:hypothetical protein